MHVLRFSVILCSFLAPALAVAANTVSASDATFLASVLKETWDTRYAGDGHYIDCMMPASDVDLSVTLATPGKVTLNFDTSVYDPKQGAGDGPRWIAEVDGVEGADIVTIGPGVSGISTGDLAAGDHRVRFVQIGNTSASGRWRAKDPQLSRVTGVTLPDGATLGKSQRAARWFLAITDSVGEGYMNVNTTQALESAGAYTDNYRAWPSVAARAMKMSIAGYMISGIGVVHRGIGTPYGVLDADDSSGQSDPWDHIFEGVPRPFSSSPAFVLLNVGLTEQTTDSFVPGRVGDGDPTSSDTSFQRNLVVFIARVRSHPILAKTPLLIGVPFGGYKRVPIQRAVAEYKKSHPDDTYLIIFDVAFGSPALATTAGIDEIPLFNGLTKNRPNDSDTIPSPQAPDRTHPYAIATPTIGSIDSASQLGAIMGERLASLVNSGFIPNTGELTAGSLTGLIRHSTVTVTSTRATGGSPPYTYQFQVSREAGAPWTNIGDPMDNQAAVLHPIQVTDHDYKRGVSYRVMVSDEAEPSNSVYSKPTPR